VSKKVDGCCKQATALLRVTKPLSRRVCLCVDGQERASAATSVFRGDRAGRYRFQCPWFAIVVRNLENQPLEQMAARPSAVCGSCLLVAPPPSAGETIRSDYGQPTRRISATCVLDFPLWLTTVLEYGRSINARYTLPVVTSDHDFVFRNRALRGHRSDQRQTRHSGRWSARLRPLD
jgi:hypothetical protein